MWWDRKYAPTDSDTSQSQHNPRYIPTQNYATSPEPIDADNDPERLLPGDGGESRANHPEIQAHPDGARHERWRLPASGEAADPLDELINGFREGTVMETDQDLVEEADLLDHHSRGSVDKISQMFGNKEDDVVVSVAFRKRSLVIAQKRPSDIDNGATV